MKPEIESQMESFNAANGDRIDPVAQALRRLYLHIQLCTCQFQARWKETGCEQCQGDKSLIEQAWLASGWQQIETAPKDGTEVLLGHANSVWIDQWVEFEDGAACWMMCDQWSEPEVPSHWRPLPSPPK